MVFVDYAREEPTAVVRFSDESGPTKAIEASTDGKMEIDGAEAALSLVSGAGARGVPSSPRPR